MKNKYEDSPYKVVLFASRNKDNKDVEGFKQRKRSFLTQKTADELLSEFEDFKRKGVSREMSRFYMSVNDRNIDVVRKNLQHHLIENPKCNLAKMENLIASLSMQKGTALTHKWMFDYDDTDENLGKFIADMTQEGGTSWATPMLGKTPNGHYLIVEKGFDTRELLKKWDKVSLHRDGMRLVEWTSRGEVNE